MSSEASRLEVVVVLSWSIVEKKYPYWFRHEWVGPRESGFKVRR